jgi:hypothetical protein
MALGKEKKIKKILCRMLPILTLGKERSFFKKISLPSAPLHSTRGKEKRFFLKNSLPSSYIPSILL